MTSPKTTSRNNKTSAPTPRCAARKNTKPPQSSPLLRTRFSPSQLLGQFGHLLPLTLMASWLARSPKAFYLRAFTPLITLWYCVFQRLSDNHHLSYIVQDARAGGADPLSPRGKALSRRLRSEATTSFSDARQRLPLQIFHQSLWHTASRISSSIQVPLWFGLKIALLDGSTTRLRPFGDIPKHFPAHRPGNCKKPPYWCIARVLVLFCLATGSVLDSAMGSLKASEQALSALILKRCWQNWLLLADRNFGVYSVARATTAAKAHLLSRLTQSRAAKLARSANVRLTPGLDTPLSWKPSSHDQCPQGLQPDPVAGRLLAARIERPGFRSFTLYLFTTLLDSQAYSLQALVQLYAQRWHVEVYLRYVKTQMDLDLLECRSADMARKEWLAGLIAYNLIRWVMAAAAALAQVPVLTLSFSRARELFLGWCIRSWTRRPSLHSWKHLLHRIAKARLPMRRKPRPPEPRAIRTFQKDFAKLVGSRDQARKLLAAQYANS